MFNKAAPIALLLLALIGLFLGMVLTSKHFDLNHAPPGPATAILGFEGVCGEGGGCAEVNTSRYAKISLGAERLPMPVSVPALGFFFMIAVLAAGSLWGSARRRRDLMALATVAFVPALAFSGYLLAVQAFVIGKFCIYCLGLDAVTVVSALLAYVSHGGGGAEIIKDLKTSPRTLVLISIAVMLIMDYRGYQMYTGWIEDIDTAASAGADDEGASPGNAETDEQALEQARSAIKEFLAAYPSLDGTPLELNPFDATKGDLDSGLVVTEFADFECPHCRLAGVFLKDIAHRYGDRVGFVFKNYPLGTACNDNLKRDVHPDACEAAVAVQCAKRQAKFWPFHDLTFENQDDLGRSKLLSIAAQLGLDQDAFEECLQKDTVLEEVRTQVRQGKEAGLEGTPTFFVNGRQLPSAHPLFVEAALRYELTERGEMVLPDDPDGLFPR